MAIAAFPTLPFGTSANLAWLFYLFILTALNDIAQFVSGKLFGKHKIAPSISPNKTWQGLLGGQTEGEAVQRMTAAIERRAPRCVFPWQLHLMVRLFNCLPHSLRILRRK